MLANIIKEFHKMWIERKIQNLINMDKHFIPYHYNNNMNIILDNPVLAMS
jgi:hypothetical protein